MQKFITILTPAVAPQLRTLHCIVHQTVLHQTKCGAQNYNGRRHGYN